MFKAKIIRRVGAIAIVLTAVLFITANTAIASENTKQSLVICPDMGPLACFWFCWLYVL